MSQQDISEALRVCGIKQNKTQKTNKPAAGGKKKKESFLNSTSYFDRRGKNGILKPSVRK